MSNEPLPFWTRTGNHVTWARSTCSSDAKGGRCGLSAAEIRSHLESYKNGRTSKGFLLIEESTPSACMAWHWHQQLVHLCPPARKESASKTVRPVTIPEEKEDAQVILLNLFRRRSLILIEFKASHNPISIIPEKLLSCAVGRPFFRLVGERGWKRQNNQKRQPCACVRRLFGDDC
jgi:hypothetical protein